MDVNKAVSGKVDRLASDIEDRLHKDKGVAELDVNREGRDDIILTFKPPADETKLDDGLEFEWAPVPSVPGMGR